MYDAHAVQAVRAGIVNEGVQFGAGHFCSQAMQIDLILDCKLAAAKLAQDAARDMRAVKPEFVSTLHAGRVKRVLPGCVGRRGFAGL